MTAGHVWQGIGTIGGGLALGLGCVVLMRSEAYLTQMAAALIKARLNTQQDRVRLVRGMRLALVFGMVVAAMIVAIGVGTLLVG